MLGACSSRLGFKLAAVGGCSLLAIPAGLRLVLRTQPVRHPAGDLDALRALRLLPKIYIDAGAVPANLAVGKPRDRCDFPQRHAAKAQVSAQCSAFPREASTRLVGEGQSPHATRAAPVLDGRLDALAGAGDLRTVAAIAGSEIVDLPALGTQSADLVAVNFSSRHQRDPA